MKEACKFLKYISMYIDKPEDWARIAQKIEYYKQKQLTEGEEK